jgi:hypothetical protein
VSCSCCWCTSFSDSPVFQHIYIYKHIYIYIYSSAQHITHYIQMRMLPQHTHYTIPHYMSLHNTDAWHTNHHFIHYTTLHYTTHLTLHYTLHTDELPERRELLRGLFGQLLGLHDKTGAWRRRRRQRDGILIYTDTRIMCMTDTHTFSKLHTRLFLPNTKQFRYKLPMRPFE